MKKLRTKLKDIFCIFAMVFGGIGCVSLLLSLPLIFVSDDVSQKGIAAFSLLLTAALFAALFALGVSLRSKNADAKASAAPETQPAESSVQPEEAQPVKETETAPPAETPEQKSPVQKEPAASSPYPQKNYEAADEDFVRALRDGPLYTIFSEQTHFVMTDLSAMFLLFPKKEDAETYVRDSGQKALSVLTLPSVHRSEVLGACRCAGFTHAAIYAGHGVYQKAPFSLLERVWPLLPPMGLGIANPDVLPNLYSWIIQEDYTKRKFTQNGETPEEFWLSHLHEKLTASTAHLLDNPLTLPVVWNNQGEPSVQALPVKTAEGETVIPVYTDRFALEHHLKAPADCVAIPRLLNDVLQNMKGHPEISGVLLNPGRENIFLSRAVLKEAETHRIRSRPEAAARANRLSKPVRQPTPEHRLYLTPILFDGETEGPEEPDLVLHVWPKAGQLFQQGHKLVLRQPLPEGLHPAKQVDARTMHGRLIKNPKTGMEFVPLYSTLDPIYKVYGENARLSVITFGEAMQLSRPYAGVILEPGPHQHILLNMKP